MNLIAELGTKLNEMGLTLQILLLAAAGLSLLFVYSLRELLCWYFKVSKILNQQTQMQNQLSQLEAKLKSLQASGDNITNLLAETPQFPILSDSSSHLKALPEEPWMSKPLV